MFPSGAQKQNPKVFCPTFGVHVRAIQRVGTNCPPPYSSDGRGASKRELRYTGRDIPYYPVYPIKEGGTIQAVDGIN